MWRFGSWRLDGLSYMLCLLAGAPTCVHCQQLLYGFRCDDGGGGCRAAVVLVRRGGRFKEGSCVSVYADDHVGCVG